MVVKRADVECRGRNDCYHVDGKSFVDRVKFQLSYEECLFLLKRTGRNGHSILESWQKWWVFKSHGLPWLEQSMWISVQSLMRLGSLFKAIWWQVLNIINRNLEFHPVGKVMVGGWDRAVKILKMLFLSPFWSHQSDRAYGLKFFNVL